MIAQAFLFNNILKILSKKSIPNAYTRFLIGIYNYLIINPKELVPIAKKPEFLGSYQNPLALTLPFEYQFY
ncbi:hypothetical protein GCM10022396_15160 [Flavivirga amylovorans]